MLSALKIVTFIVLLAFDLTVRAAVFRRQAVPTDIPTTAPSISFSASPHQSTVTIIVIVTPIPNPSPIVSISVPSVSNTSQSTADNHNSNNKGAIAGGVLGALAVIVAASAAFVWFRRRSPKHWRNRTAGRWQSFNNKNASDALDHSSVYVGDPVQRAQGDIKQSDPNPLPPIHIRDRQPAARPFEDASGSPAFAQSHGRAGSMLKIGYNRRESSSVSRFDVELQPKAGAAANW